MTKFNKMKKNTKRLGIAAFLFFLIKGLLWIAAAYYGISLFSHKAKSAEVAQQTKVIKKNSINNLTKIEENAQTKDKYKDIDINKIRKRALTETLPVEVYGRKDAPVKITAFLSVSCGFCRKEYLEDIPKILKEYVKTGKAQISIHHYPIDESAIEIEMILSKLGTQDALNKKLELFKHQPEWLEPYYTGNKEKAIEKIAAITKLDPSKIKEILSDNGLKDAILMKNIILENQFKGLDGTPYFIINDKVYDHGLRFAKLKEIIEKELTS